MTTSAIPLSVVVGTTRPWPELRGCLDSFFGEARSLGAEVIVVDRDGRGLPAEAEDRYPGVVHLSEAGASIYRLRSLGLCRARGDVVLITEDHCRGRAGWCSTHLRAHARHPDAAAVGGAVVNAASESIVDWASFLLGHSRFVPPLADGGCAAVDRSNESYKQHVLPREPSPMGMDEPPTDERLLAAGNRFYVDGEAIIEHDQELRLREALAIHFHNGRAVAGLRLRRGMSPQARLGRLLASLAVGPAFFARTVGVMARRRVYPPRAWASLPVLLAITFAVGAGLLAGFAAGPSRSPLEIR